MHPSIEFLERAAYETGYQVSPLEKVILLGELAGDITRHPLLGKTLILKGGTAFNLCFGAPSRISVDLDFNYIGHLERDRMLNERPEVEEAVIELSRRHGYIVQQSPDAFAGRKLYLSYTSVLGPTDRIEVDLNYLFRLPIAEPKIRDIWQPGGLDRPQVRVVNLSELIIGKLLAFLDRGAVRDAWDIGRLPDIAEDELQSPLFRARFIAMAATLDHPLMSYKSKRMDQRLTEREITEELVPLLTAGDADDVNAILERTRQVIEPFFSLSEVEEKYIEAITGGELSLSLLFPQHKEEAEHLARHPALLWKMANVKRHLALQKDQHA